MIEVPRLREEELMQTRTGETSAQIRERVCRARAIQSARFATPLPAEPEDPDMPEHPALTEPLTSSHDTPIGSIKRRTVYRNAQMGAPELRAFCETSESARNLLRAAITQLGLSARAYDRLLKVARTIADLRAASQIEVGDIAEAVTYRSLDRKLANG